MPLAPSLTFRALAVLSGAIAFPCVAGETADSADLAPSPSFVSPERPDEVRDIGDTEPDQTAGSDPAEVEAADSEAAASEAREVTADDQEATGAGEASDIDMGCLSRTICAIKQKIHWQTPAWSQSQCDKVAGLIQAAAKKNDISTTLLLAIMINESDLNEKAARVTLRGNRVYAKDSGLMAIRCILDKRNRCLNGSVRGMSLTDVMNPATNIDLGAHELAYWRDGGVSRTTMWKRSANGHVGTVTKTIRCRHKDHAFWAHYNHGPYYIDHGYPRHYPHRVAVIDHALAGVLNLDPPELHGGRITIHDAGKRDRTIDRPLEARYRKLCTQIQSIGTCSPVAYN